MDALIEKGFYVNPCGGANSDKMLRIGHIGFLTEQDILNLVSCLKEF